MLIIIIYLLSSFLFHWFSLECIIIVFFLVCVSSLWAFLSFGALAFVGFLLLNKDGFFMLSHFSLTAIDFQGTLHLAFGLVGNKVFIFIIWRMSFRCFLKVIELVSYSHHIMITNITVSLLVSEDQSYCEAFTVWVCRFKWICAETILAKEEYASRFKTLFIHFLFMNI